jgi:ferritin-like metal-binding protein YciE
LRSGTHHDGAVGALLRARINAAKGKKMKIKQVEQLVLQSLEHEMGGVDVYTTALTCAQNAGLRKEWEKYLAETRTHVTALEAVCEAMEIDAKKETPGRAVVRHTGGALVESMKMARAARDPAAAELVACECVVIAETKDHANWELLSKCVEHLSGRSKAVLKSACDTIEDQEDEHLYHSQGWCRELWIHALGLTAVLPPPEERQHVKTAIGAARAEQSADKGR